MKQHAQQRGYVMVFTLMVIVLIVALVTIMANKSRVHVRYVKTMIEREKAKALAWSGVQIAFSQLATIDELPEKKEKKEKAGEGKKQGKPDSTERAKQFITKILPIINTWQTFKLSQKNDGVRGEIKICIGCEGGKINLNQCFDFVKKKFINEGAKKNDCKKLLQQIFAKIKKVQGGDSLFPVFDKFLKERQNKLYDPTELLTIKEFASFKNRIFFVPGGNVGQKGEQEKQTIYLNDIFTLWSSKKELDPWLLSHSLKSLLGFKVVKKGDTQFKEKQLKERLKEFKLGLSWPDSWNKMLAPLYGKKFDQLSKEVQAAMSTKFEPSVFSVLSYGIVGGVTQKLLVIIERLQAPSTDSSGGTSFTFRAKRFYWL